MESHTLIPVDEYLATAYRPDCDYVDGELLERNLGELDHNRIQKKLLLYFATREAQWGVEAIQEQRVQVGPKRFRIPDVTVVLGRADEQVLTRPPHLCVEILSPEDRMSRMEERVSDYLAMGVTCVWVIDPHTKAAFTITPAEGWREVKTGVLRTAHSSLEVPLAEIFA